ncbi:DUF1499 domain-containing protein [Terrihabitans sp. B22-R8]|uniref:DUF1499 domain-containing protein n=1 Tax=Terrihabitans sp. B22-R8 TaxID=3425128 RepID=UPI00403D299A
MNNRFRASDYEPYARTAIWSRRLGCFSVAVAIVAVFAQRSDRLEPVASVASLGAAGLLAVLAIVLSLAAFAVIWWRGVRGGGAAIIGALAGLVVLAAPVGYATMFWRLPAISDIATDPASPPAFLRSAGERTAQDNPADYPVQSAAVQTEAYPDIAPLQIATPPEEVFSVARELVGTRGWRVLGTDMDGAVWRIEAVATTPVLRLPQDVSIEIRPATGGARIDVRSALRWGQRDFGSNARLIRRFVTDLAAALN